MDYFCDMEFDVKHYHGRPLEGNENRTEAELAVYDFLDNLGVEYDTLCHPAAFTMEECEAVRSRAGAPVFKNLFLTNRQQTQFFLLMIPADKPFIHDTEGKVRLIIDNDLRDCVKYACHPCVNTSSIVLSLSDLLEKIIPATNHDFTWVTLKPE